MINEQPLEIVFFDIETGGLTPDCTAFEYAFALWKDGSVIDGLNLRIKSDRYIVTAKALEVNKINIVNHDKHSLDPKEASKVFYDWLRRHFPDERRFITLGAHHIEFDLQWFKPFFALGAPEGVKFHKTFSYRYVDTSAVIRALAHAGIFPPDVGNLAHACEIIGNPIPDDMQHTAMGDVVATANLYTYMLHLINPKFPELSELAEKYVKKDTQS